MRLARVPGAARDAASDRGPAQARVRAISGACAQGDLDAAAGRAEIFGAGHRRV